MKKQNKLVSGIIKAKYFPFIKLKPFIRKLTVKQFLILTSK